MKFVSSQLPKLQEVMCFNRKRCHN